MYYIINQNDQIVAIDPQLLSSLNIDNADTFYKKVALQEITFELEGKDVTVNVDGRTIHYSVSVSPLSGMLGDIRLIDIDPESVTEEASAEKEAQDNTPLSLDEIDLFGIKEESDETSMETPDEKPAEATPPETLQIVEEEDELFELILPTDADNAIAEIEGHGEEAASTQAEDIHTEKETDVPIEVAQEEEDNSPIFIDIAHISQTIGISPEDYKLFLNEYIDTALTFEQALQSNDEKEKKDALHTLTHLSNVLHLPFVGEILEKIKNASPAQRDSAIEAFFSTLGRVTTSQFEEQKAVAEEEIPEKAVEETPKEAFEETPQKSAETVRPAIDLSHVKPTHFDFQLEEAAKDLSLPVELIEEFVHDFITQAHEETEKMLAAYEKGDLETVQKIGHLLKGTSSNLRINPLSDTLYEIQFNEDIDRVPELVKNYWAHFLSLENQIKLISKK
jgi:HPt (histidine-containing phosphotransfer) domain-containing protein